MRRPMDFQAPFDVAVVGGGPAGVAAALWAARYRRRVILIDSGHQRNRWTTETHGYVGLEGTDPQTMIAVARQGLARYREVDVVDDRTVCSGSVDDGVFGLELDDGRCVRALRVVLATGVRDVFPEVDDFEAYYGRSIFTCPSCDGYEAQDKAVAVVGDGPEMTQFALGLLDWASSVILVRERGGGSVDDLASRPALPLAEVTGRVVGINGNEAQVRSLSIDDGQTVPCDVVFWMMRHEQQSDLAERLGCRVSAEGCVEVDDDGATTVAGVYAAGDMTPGPQLVQVAAAKGARAGIAAATSLRGHAGSPMSPRPAPAPDGRTV